MIYNKFHHCLGEVDMLLLFFLFKSCFLTVVPLFPNMYKSCYSVQPFVSPRPVPHPPSLCFVSSAPTIYIIPGVFNIKLRSLQFINNNSQNSLSLGIFTKCNIRRKSEIYYLTGTLAHLLFSKTKSICLKC